LSRKDRLADIFAFVAECKLYPREGFPFGLPPFLLGVPSLLRINAPSSSC